MVAEAGRSVYLNLALKASWGPLMTGRQEAIVYNFRIEDYKLLYVIVTRRK
jgi:hypothetical protein